MRMTKQILISPAEYVIGQIGGLTRTANALGLRVSTVQGWKMRGQIPQKHWIPLIEAANAAGKNVSLPDFLTEHEAPARPKKARAVA